MQSPRIKLVTFDALHTILTPRLPIQVQYARVLKQYLGQQLDPKLLKSSMKTAIMDLQAQSPVYDGGANAWWREVIKQTALGAGATEGALEKHLDEITPRLMKLFSSKEGYREFDDTLRVFQQLRRKGLKLGVVSNADSRMRGVLDDLKLTEYLDIIVLSEEANAAKPEKGIFVEALRKAKEKLGLDILPHETLHVGDELLCDYHGAKDFGMDAVLLRRPGTEGEQAHVEDSEDLSQVAVIAGLDEVVGRATSN